MSNEFVLSQFLNAKGKRMEVGQPAPDESASNLNGYRALGLIGDQAALDAKGSKPAAKVDDDAMTAEQEGAVNEALTLLLAETPDKKPSCKDVEAMVGFNVSAADRDRLFEALPTAD